MESRTTITDTRSGKSARYLFFASCKSEDTFAPRGLFYRNNYDFNGIFSDQEYVIFRAYSSHTPRFREDGLWKGTFVDVTERLVEVEGTVLGGGEEIVRASMAGKPLLGRVELASGDGGLNAEIDMHVKRLSSAFVAYNVDSFAEFIVQQPVASPENGSSVTPYSWPILLPAKTSVVAIE